MGKKSKLIPSYRLICLQGERGFVLVVELVIGIGANANHWVVLLLPLVFWKLKRDENEMVLVDLIKVAQTRLDQMDSKLCLHYFGRFPHSRPDHQRSKREPPMQNSLRRKCKTPKDRRKQRLTAHCLYIIITSLHRSWLFYTNLDRISTPDMMFSKPFAATTIGCLLLLQCSPFARATYSIVATESDKKQRGGAGFSCVPGGYSGQDLWYNPETAPEVNPRRRNNAPLPATLSDSDRSVMSEFLSAMGLSGDTGGLTVAIPIAVVLSNTTLYNLMAPIILSDVEYFTTINPNPNSPIFWPSEIDLETNNSTPAEILDIMEGLKNPTIKFRQSLRQDILAYYDRTEGNTGSNLTTLMGYIYGEGFEYTDIGFEEKDPYRGRVGVNIGEPGTAQAMLDGFADEPDNKFGACDLPGRLMNAMHSVMEQGLGDARCRSEYNTTGSVGYLRVEDDSDGSFLIDIHAGASEEGDEPVTVMEREFLEWRAEHPCPTDAPSGAPTSGTIYRIAEVPICLTFCADVQKFVEGAVAPPEFQEDLKQAVVEATSPLGFDPDIHLAGAQIEALCPQCIPDSIDVRRNLQDELVNLRFLFIFDNSSPVVPSEDEINQALAQAKDKFIGVLEAAVAGLTDAPTVAPTDSRSSKKSKSDKKKKNAKKKSKSGKKGKKGPKNSALLLRF